VRPASGLGPKPKAALALAEEHDFASITVQDITRRADVNRGTFYLHYRDKEDLCARALDALFDELTAEDRAFVDAHPSLAPETVPSGVVAQFRQVAERPELYRRLLGGAGSSSFAARLRAYHEQQFLRVWRDMGLVTQAGSPPAGLRARFAASAAQGVIDWWLGCDPGESPEAMAAWVWTLCAPLWFEDATVATDDEPATAASAE
jgi:AcrR family transcriptional regulator